ncbi:hypothetical protein U9M48_002439, partial [Paspalum notatum var. saurae]
DFELRKLILDESHNSQFAIHHGSNKMYQDLKQRFWWIHIKREIARYVSECDVCQRVNVKHLKPMGTLQPLPIPSWKWESISMDFITGLPNTRDGYDSIWVIVDRVTKSAYFLLNFPTIIVTNQVLNSSELVRVGRKKVLWSGSCLGSRREVRLIQERLCAAQVRQKHYADRRRRELSFDQGDYLKVTPFKGTKRFQEKGKLAHRFVGPLKILARVGAVAYRLDMPSSLSSIHPVFHVSQLRKCIRVPTEVTNLEEIDLHPNLAYQEHPIRILDQAERKTRNKTTKFVKVQWSRHSEREATWEKEDRIQQAYPNLFLD